MHRVSSSFLVEKYDTNYNTYGLLVKYTAYMNQTVWLQLLKTDSIKKWIHVCS